MAGNDDDEYYPETPAPSSVVTQQSGAPAQQQGGGDYYPETPAPDTSRGNTTGAPGDDWQQDGDGHTYSQDGYRVVMRGTTDTANASRQDANAAVDAQLNELQGKIATNPGLFGGLTDLPDILKYLAAKMNQKNAVNQKVQDSLSASAKNLAQGLDLRPKPSVGNTDYANVDHKVMHQMVNQNINASQVGEGGQAMVQAGNALTQLQQGGTTAISASQAQWGGTAGDQARQFTVKMVNYIGTAGIGMQLTGTQLSRQSEAASLAKNAMPDVVPYDPAAMNQQLQSMSSNPVAMHQQYLADMAQFQKAKAAQQQAAHVMQSYDNSLGGATTTPIFQPPPTMADTGGGPVKPIDFRNEVLYRERPPELDHNTSNETKNVSPPPTEHHPVDKPPPVPPPKTEPVPPPRHVPVDPPYDPPTPPRNGPVETDPRQGPPVGTDPQSYNGPPSGGGFSGGGGGGSNGAFGADMLGAGALGGMGAGVAGFGDGESVRSGNGFGSGARGGAGAGGAGAEGMGRGAGAGAGGLEGRAGAAGAAGAAGRGSGMGMPPRGKGKKEEDEEHYAPSFLVEHDPDSIFGSDVKTAPPVIGE